MMRRILIWAGLCRCALTAGVSRLAAEDVTFIVDPLRTTIQVTDFAYVPEIEDFFPMNPQVTTGDVANYIGTVTGDLVGDTLTFDGNSALVALEHPQVLNFTPEEGGPGGPEDPAAQAINYAYFLEGVRNTTLYVQFFNIVWGLPAGKSVTHAQPPTNTDLELTAGNYALVLEDPDIVNDTAYFNQPFDVLTPGDHPVSPNTSTNQVTLVTQSGIQTLTIPLQAVLEFNVDISGGQAAPTRLVVAGNVVATRTISQLACDLNGDGSADAADAGIMFGNWGNAGVGDCSSDGVVDAADAGILFGEWTGDSLAGGNRAVVPEPAAAAGWLTVVVLPFLRRRCRDRLA